jgi:hypothetical protein
MIDKISERIQNKQQFIENVQRLKARPSTAAITAKNICMDEVDFLKEVLQYIDDLEKEVVKLARERDPRWDI